MTESAIQRTGNPLSALQTIWPSSEDLMAFEKDTNFLKRKHSAMQATVFSVRNLGFCGRGLDLGDLRVRGSGEVITGLSLHLDRLQRFIRRIEDVNGFFRMSGLTRREPDLPNLTHILRSSEDKETGFGACTTRSLLMERILIRGLFWKIWKTPPK